MKRLWRKLICGLIGHSIDPCDEYACGCLRCGLQFYFDDPPRSDLRFFLSWYNWRLRWKLRAAREWLKCPYCGGRFGRHDYYKCIPF